jgi:ubiquinone/menaquinone biosynthesis C-methylase UbiE
MVPAIFARWAPLVADAAGVKTGERVLDLACGTGALTRVIADRVGPHGRVLGLDLSAGMLARARAGDIQAQFASRFAGSGKHTEWMQGDATALPLPDSCFDAVVCQQGFQFFPDKPAALREIRRVLAADGRLTLAVWRGIDQAPGFRVLQEAMARHVSPENATLAPFRWGDGSVIRELVGNAGFHDVQVRAEVKLTRFQSAEHFVRSFAAGSSSRIGAVSELTPDAVEEIVREVVERTRHYADDEGWATPHASNIITAVK